MRFTLQTEQLQAVVESEGAWLVEMSQQGQPVLFPKQTLTAADGSQKLRGGSHVCLPNFGPDASGRLAQHGFGREQPWQVIDQQSNQVTLELLGGAPGYEALRSQVAYHLEGARLTMTLQVSNTGAQPLRIAPAFHPYFQVTPDARTVVLQQQVRTVADFGVAQFEAASELTLSLPGRTIVLSAVNLPVWAEWTDQLGPYFCVEPTQSGFSFDTQGTPEHLQPGEEKSYQLTIQL